MSNNLKHFVMGALLAAVPMSYWVSKSVPRPQTQATEAKRVTKAPELDNLFWNSKLTEKAQNEPKVLASSVMVSAWTFTKTDNREDKPKATPTPTVKPAANPKPAAELAYRPKTQTALYVTHNEVGPADVVGIIERYANEYGVNRDMMVHIANCESGFRSNAVNGPYVGIYQFVASTWISNRNAMGLNPDPNLRYNLEEAVKTAAFKMSRDGFGAWPACQIKARRLISLNSESI